ncbi:MAG: FAD-dependent oxidoreductase [Patescibacteria group bacterium]|jgi:thioredoxin-disulfide reductase
MYDLIIIGSGVAGMTAGIFASRREMKTLIIGKELGGQLIWASEIENYPGFETINSFDLINKIKQQTIKLGVEFKDDEVQEIKKTTDDSFVIYTNRESFEAKTVIIAMGLSPRRLAVPREVELNGKGVSYCANCDGPLYKNKVVAVIGGGNSALDAAEMLSKIAKQVYSVHRNESFKAFDVLVDEVKNRPNIEILFNSEIKDILGDQKVEKIKILNSKTKETREISLEAVFVEVGRIAATDLVSDLVERSDRNQIIVDSAMETKTPGLFAAGDVVDSEFKQITIAIGSATVAALSAYKYLQMKIKK